MLPTLDVAIQLFLCEFASKIIVLNAKAVYNGSGLRIEQGDDVISLKTNWYLCCPKPDFTPFEHCQRGGVCFQNRLHKFLCVSKVCEISLFHIEQF